ncbi:hypothetical protein B0H13DRAFT_1934826 [Mycena leptocephala]|nr:hypothetical protein B0H13DRAFT_1934826 [Mycena leptocephala]
MPAFLRPPLDLILLPLLLLTTGSWRLKSIQKNFEFYSIPLAVVTLCNPLPVGVMLLPTIIWSVVHETWCSSILPRFISVLRSFRLLPPAETICKYGSTTSVPRVVCAHRGEEPQDGSHSISTSRPCATSCIRGWALLGPYDEWGSYSALGTLTILTCLISTMLNLRLRTGSGSDLKASDFSLKEDHAAENILFWWVDIEVSSLTSSFSTEHYHT